MTAKDTHCCPCCPCCKKSDKVTDSDEVEAVQIGVEMQPLKKKPALREESQTKGKSEKPAVVASEAKKNSPKKAKPTEPKKTSSREELNRAEREHESLLNGEVSVEIEPQNSVDKNSNEKQEPKTESVA